MTEFPRPEIRDSVPSAGTEAVRHTRSRRWALPPARRVTATAPAGGLDEGRAFGPRCIRPSACCQRKRRLHRSVGRIFLLRLLVDDIAHRSTCFRSAPIGGYEAAPGWSGSLRAAAPGGQPWGTGWSTGAVSSSLNAVGVFERQHVDANEDRRVMVPWGTPCFSNSRTACSRSSRLATLKLVGGQGPPGPGRTGPPSGANCCSPISRSPRTMTTPPNRMRNASASDGSPGRGDSTAPGSRACWCRTGGCASGL